MGKSSLVTILLPFALAVPGISPADPLQDDYAQLETQRRSLEAERTDYEARIEQGVSRVARQKASWNACVERISYPERVCWEEPRLDAAARETALAQRRGEFEALRGEFESERRTLESRRREIEALFGARGRGRAYEGEFRGYMRDTDSYLGRARQTLLQGYGDYLSDVNAYAQFVEEQANACPAPKPCEFAQRLDALSAQRESVQQKRRALETRLNATLNPDAAVPAMLQAAERLWSQFAERPPAGASLAALESNREAMEQERASLEVQRRAVERQRATFEQRRVQLEAARARLESENTGEPRGADYQEALLSAYVEPMAGLMDQEQRLFDNYRDYESAVLLYVYWIKETVSTDPEMRAAAAAAFAGYGDEMRELATRLRDAQGPSAAAATPAEAPAPSADSTAASSPDEVEMAALELAGTASAAEEMPPPPQAGTADAGSVSGTLVGLMRAYVGKIRDNVVSLGQSG